MERSRVLVVDDDREICDLICEELGDKEYNCEVSSNANDALAKLKRNSFDVALMDIKLPGISGLDLLKTVRKQHQMTAILMITGVNDVNTAVEAMKLGALDYIIKPFPIDKLTGSISTALINRNLQYNVYSTITSLRRIECDNNAESRSLNQINAVARGVDARVDHFDFHSKIVTDKTVELARWLGLPSKEIEEWAFARDKLSFARDRHIRSMLNKLEVNPIAQVTLSVAWPVCPFPKSGDMQN